MYKKILFLVLPLLFLVPFIKVGYSFAVEGSFSEYEQKILDNKREQEEVNKKINELKDQEVTLKNQISYIFRYKLPLFIPIKTNHMDTTLKK